MYCYNYSWESKDRHGVSFAMTELPIDSVERFEELRQASIKAVKEELGFDVIVFGPITFLHENND
jgi:hypothetical protein